MSISTDRSFFMQLSLLKSIIIDRLMNPEERNIAINKFIEYLRNSPSRSTHRIAEELSDINVDESSLPKLESVNELMNYHQDITGTIGKTFRQVSDIMDHMKELKNRKKNVLKIIDTATAIVEIKRISYGLGSDPKEIYNNLQTYYDIKDKVYYVDKFVDRIEAQIAEVQKDYQATFDAEMTKNNSNNIAQLSKVLQLIRKHTHKQAKPDTLQQIVEYCVSNANKEFKKIEEQLFAIPIVGNSESNYQFFDMAKTAMKVIVTLSGNCKINVVKVSGQDGLILVLKRLFELTAGGIILQLLIRLKKYYEIDKISLSQSKFTLKEKEQKRLQPYFKEYVAIWNQLERLRNHLLSDVNQNCPKKHELKMQMESIINSANFVQINANAIQFMQAALRYKFDKLLKTSPFVNAICTFDSDFFKEVNAKNITHNPESQDFLEQTMSRISEGIQRALQTLNTMIISAIINFVNHNLIFEDVFYSFNELFTRSFSKLPSTDSKPQYAVLLVLNALAAVPRALKTLLHIALPQEISSPRIKAELQEVVNNNQQKAGKVMIGLLGKIVGAEWFRYQLSRDYQCVLQKWMGLQSECFSRFVQQVSKVHAETILETEFSKKYTHSSATSFEKQVRAIISFYERHSHSIISNFTAVIDFINILLLEDEEDFRRVTSKLIENYPESELRRIWNLRV